MAKTSTPRKPVKKAVGGSKTEPDLLTKAAQALGSAMGAIAAKTTTAYETVANEVGLLSKPKPAVLKRVKKTVSGLKSKSGIKKSGSKKSVPKSTPAKKTSSTKKSAAKSVARKKVSARKRS